MNDTSLPRELVPLLEFHPGHFNVPVKLPPFTLTEHDVVSMNTLLSTATSLFTLVTLLNWGPLTYSDTVLFLTVRSTPDVYAYTLGLPFTLSRVRSFSQAMEPKMMPLLMYENGQRPMSCTVYPLRSMTPIPADFAHST